jgi:general secretion pathway protein H
MRRSKPRARHDAAGFTLVEALVALAIVAVVLTASLGAVRWRTQLDPVTVAARDLATQLRTARADAIRSNRETLVRIDLDQRATVLVPRGDKRALPQGLPVAVTTAQANVLGARVSIFRFFPDGSASGGHIDFGAGPSSRRLVVDWLTGRIDTVAGGAT